jgi:dihydroorotase
VNEVVKWLCEKPVELYGVQEKGRIAPGFDADIVLVDLKQTRTIRDGQLHSKCNWSPYDGWKIQGWPVITLVNGNVVFRDGEFFDEVKGREVLFRNR